MKNNSKLFEIEDRYCPICGKFIKAGSPMHRCLDEDLKRIEKEEKIKKLHEDELNEKEEEKRDYTDKLYEFEEFYNSDNYYDNDIEEE